MNANRMLGITTNAQAKSTEKLSSGYKINRAADDAAGLAISEKMRRQIRGLTQASANAQDGISAVQTAEGALTEVHDMLQRMNELAIKAGNGTMSESDRQSIQDEIDQLITEIDRVSETTKFNETYLLKGEGKDGNSGEVSARIDSKMQDAVITKATGNIFKGTLDMTAATKLDAGTEDKATFTYLDEEGNKRTKDVTFKTGADAKTTAANLAEAVNADKDLKKIFKASSDNKGEFVVESKLNGTKTDGSKNKVTDVVFASRKQADGKTDADKTRWNQFVDGSVATEDAKGEAYSFGIGADEGVTTAGAVQAFAAGDIFLKDGESITVNGKTYTFDADKGNTAANSFKTLEDLQKLLGDEYEVELYVSADEKTTTYTHSSKTGTTTADLDKSSETNRVSTNVTATASTTALNAIAQAQIGANLYKNDAATTATNDATKVGEVAATEKNYSNLKLELRITEKSTVDKASDVLNFSLQVGADTTEENKINVGIESMSAKSLGIDNVTVTGKDSTNADEAVNTIADAIAKVSAQRSALGAIQNRLEHTINNLDNVVENTTSAEAQIRDTDIATEMVRYSNNSILQQAGTSMLSQANQSNQLALSLLG